MAEQEHQDDSAQRGEGAEGGGEAKAEQEPVKQEEKIMCFVSKKMVPVSETVEIEYMPHKKVRVLPRYIRYEMEV